ncbi:MAG: helix-turn-helix domain-containing protein [Cyclobacteriaceae bacterium]
MNIRSILLSSEERSALKEGYQHGHSAAFRKRCHAILLKSEGRLSKDVGNILGMHPVTVNSWLTRYEQQGMAGLKTKPGRGRKAILNQDSDEGKIRAAVQQERQRLKLAKEALEEELGKRFSVKTLQRFLKSVAADGSV